MAIYTCVLLDVDNTLLDFDAAERQALTDMLTEYDLPHDAAACETYHAVNRELWDALAKGQLTRKRLFQVRFSRFMQAVGVPDNGKGAAMNDRYEELLSTHADLMPGALTALEELGEVATLAIVSNGSISVQEPRIAASGIDRFMDGIYISEKIGAAKPSAKFFEYALRDLGITNRRRVLVVGSGGLSHDPPVPRIAQASASTSTAPSAPTASPVSGSRGRSQAANPRTPTVQPPMTAARPAR